VSVTREPAPDPHRSAHLRDVAALFLKLGLIAFGGPAAHIGLMRHEVVERRRWLSEQEFLDLLGASNLIPGPTSTELAIYIGYSRAGPLGLVLAGVQAIYGLLRTAIKTWLLGAVVLLTVVMYFVGLNPLVPLFGLAIGVAVIENRGRLRVPALVMWAPTVELAQAASAGFSYGVLFLTFLKIGATLYGSGYVLLAFLHDDFVSRLGWLTDQQLLDAVAVGQFTPGPVFTTATFIGYLVGGWPGAILATVAIFLPSFVFVAIVYPLVPRLRASPWTSAFLNGANAAAVGLMAAVAWQLGTSSLVDVVTAALAVVAGVLLIRFRVNSAWLVLGGGTVGLVASAVRG
jgi:chromate transporter